MTRKSKIARLPRGIRDELNRRLDNGESGVRLVKWLNELPEAREVLARDFQGHAITPQNLSEWKSGGYQDWLEEQSSGLNVQEFMADAQELSEGGNGKLCEALFMMVVARFAVFMDDFFDRPAGGKKAEKDLRAMSRVVRDVVNLRACETEIQRLELSREWLELERRRLELAERKSAAAMRKGEKRQETGDSDTVQERVQKKGTRRSGVERASLSLETKESSKNALRKIPNGAESLSAGPHLRLEP